MKRKIFMLCSVWHEDYSRELLQGIRKRIQNEDVELHVFVSFDAFGDSDYQQKQQEIFSLPDIKDYDGVLIASISEGSFEVIDEKFSAYKKYNKKMLSIERKLDGAAYMGLDNYTEFYQLVEHFLVEHNCEQINYLGGPEDNKDNQERFRAFCDCMQKHGHQVEPQRVKQLRFLHMDGRIAYQEWKEKGLHLPDVVICANDNMALGYCDAATEDGYSAPDDFLISGFDNFDEGQFFCPSITSVNHNWPQLGYDSMNRLLAMIENDTEAEDYEVSGRLQLNESCGCGLVTRNIREDFRYIYHSKKQEEVLEIKQRLNRQLLNVSRNLEEMQKNLEECLNRLEIANMAFCINGSLFDGERNKAACGYDEIPYVITKQGGEKIAREKTLDTEYLNQLGKSQIYLYSALHLGKDTYGYAVIPYTTHRIMKNDLYRTFLESASLAIENIRQREELNRMNHKLQQLYVRDAMTGLYNRFGYINQAEAYFQKHNACIYLIYIDMDNLKKINDNYGHVMGDKAINGIALAIKEIFAKDSICVRMGGDEFLVLDGSRSEEEVIQKEEAVLQYLEEYRLQEEIPVSLTASMGHICSTGSSESLEQLVKRADTKMYEIKSKRKMNKGY